jgi:signal transduction histidine kinase
MMANNARAYARPAMADEQCGRQQTGQWLRRPAVADAGLVLVLAVASVVWARVTFVDGKAEVLFGTGWVAVLIAWWTTAGIALGALFVRRRFPALVFLVTGAVALYHMSQGWGALPVDAAAPLALLSVVAHRRRAISTAITVGTLVAAFGWAQYTGRLDTAPRSVFSGSASAIPLWKTQRVNPTPVAKVYLASHPPWRTSLPSTGWGGFPVLGLVTGLAWLAGQNSRHRRAYLDTLLQRTRDLERDRTRQAEQAVAAERSRISRELHDVVAHGLSVIVVQAQGGAAELNTRPEHTRQALEAIVTTGRESLTEMRRMLDIVRGPMPNEAPWEPQPGLAALPHLVGRLRQAGLRVEIEAGGLSGIPAGVDVSAFRMVQEALTNVVKHGGRDAAAMVRLRRSEELLHIEVTDDGIGPQSVGDSGHGLRGIRERVALLGGELDAGPGPDGGFQVRVRLPVGGR